MPDMLLKLYDLPELVPIVKGLADQGIIVRRAMPYEKHLVVDWVRNSFGDGWASECDVAFGKLPGHDRRVENIRTIRRRESVRTKEVES